MNTAARYFLLGIDDGEREPNRDRRVHRVAAFFKNCRAHFRRLPDHCRNHGLEAWVGRTAVPASAVERGPNSASANTNWRCNFIKNRGGKNLNAEQLRLTYHAVEASQIGGAIDPLAAHTICSCVLASCIVSPHPIIQLASGCCI